MSVSKILKRKAAGGYLGILTMILGIFIAGYYCVFSIKEGVFHIPLMICLVLGIFCELICAVREIGILPVAAMVLYESALMLFVKSNLGSFVNYFNGVGMFGGSGDITTIFILIALFLILIVIEIVSCFMKRSKEK